MELKSFVAQTLIQIVEGVVESSERVAALGGAVSPTYIGSETAQHVGRARGDGQPIQGVRFDVAVSIEASASQDSREMLRVASVGSESVAGGVTSSERSLSRIQFVVPLQLPTDPKSQDDADKRIEESRIRADRDEQAIRNARRGSTWMSA